MTEYNDKFKEYPADSNNFVIGNVHSGVGGMGEKLAYIYWMLSLII